MNPMIIGTVAQLGMSLVNLYAQQHAATSTGDVQKATVILGMIGQVGAAIQLANTTLAQAHLEGWTQTDPRWDPVFASADAALDAAIARLT